MKNSMFNIVLLVNVCFSISALYASDQNSRFSDIDKNIFTVNGRIASPYKTQFVDSLSDAFFVIESNPIQLLYDNAYERTMSKSVITCDDFENTNWGPYMSKVMNDRMFLNKLPQFIYLVVASSGENAITKIVDNTLIMIPENGLFTLLQYTYGIKRDAEKAEFLLSADGTNTISVKPLLMKIVNKYRAYEQQDLVQKSVAMNKTEI